MIKKITFSILSILFIIDIYAQDIHSSQQEYIPVYFNPSQAGLFMGDQRIVADYRNQWKSINSPYSTSLFSFDMNFLKKRQRSGYLGMGILAYSDKAGDLNYGTNFFQFSLSGIIKANDNSLISAGSSFNYSQESVSNSNMQWGTQYTNGSYNASNSSLETINLSSFSAINTNAGISYMYFKNAQTLSSNDNLIINVGLGVDNILKLKNNFITQESYGNIKYLFHFNSLIGLKNTPIALKPSIYYANQIKAQEVILGMGIRYMLQESSKYTSLKKAMALNIGLKTRLGDAIIPYFAIEFNQFLLGISYDMNYSKLSNATNSVGGFEITLSFTNPNPFRSSGSSKSRFN